jgi:hypothetical protein
VRRRGLPLYLEDTLSICLLVAAQRPEQLERAALRWLGRYCLARLREDRDDAAATLRQLASR